MNSSSPPPLLSSKIELELMREDPDLGVGLVSYGRAHGRVCHGTVEWLRGSGERERERKIKRERERGHDSLMRVMTHSCVT